MSQKDTPASSPPGSVGGLTQFAFLKFSTRLVSERVHVSHLPHRKTNKGGEQSQSKARHCLLYLLRVRCRKKVLFVKNQQLTFGVFNVMSTHGH